jgi:hypothetical protein
MLSSYDPTMDACWSGEASELNDGRRGRKKPGVCGEVPGKKLGVEFRDRRG